MIAAYSDIGGRSENEDFGYDRDRHGAFWVSIADGLGNYGGGKIASEIAVEEARAFFPTDPFAPPGRWSSFSTL